MTNTYLTQLNESPVSRKSRSSIEGRAQPLVDRKTLAILVASPLTRNIYDRIGADLAANYFSVVVIDCLDWVRKYKKGLAYNEVSDTTIQKVSNEAEFLAVLESRRPSFVLDFIGRGKYTRRIQILCRKISALYITQLLTPIANPDSERDIGKLFVSNPLRTMQKGAGFILRRIIENKPLPPDIALLAGVKSNGPWTDTARKKIFTATPDYFSLQEIKKSGANIESLNIDLEKDNYILFIDDCLAMSFDFSLGTFAPIYSVEEYFPKLNNFFRQLEEHYAIPVAIAAHPNGKEFPGYKELFGKRTVMFDSTGLLAMHCRFTMTHFSSAISYPVMLRKKIILVSSRRLKVLRQGEVIRFMAEQLKCPEVVMDGDSLSHEFERLDSFDVLESGYKTYEERYIGNSKASDSNPFEVLFKHLSTL